jgi:hypothetical protein
MNYSNFSLYISELQMVRVRYRKHCRWMVSNGDVECKGKVRPRTGHEVPEGGLMFSSTLSLTSALDGVGG